MSINREYYETGVTSKAPLNEEPSFGTKKPKEQSFFSKLQRMIASTIAIIIFFMAMLAILKIIDPDIFYKLKLSFGEVSSVTDTKAERDRISKINLLPISSEKQQILINNEIFLGAAKHMIILSLGEPIVKDEYADKQGNPVSRWEYKRPRDGDLITILEFQGNILVKTYHNREPTN